MYFTYFIVMIVEFGESGCVCRSAVAPLTNDNQTIIDTII